MPNRRRKAKATIPISASDVAEMAKSNPYIRRVVEDSKLRDNVRQAYESSRSAYGRLTNGKTSAESLMKDKKLQRDVRQALESIRDASISLTDAPKRRARKRFRAGRVFVIGTVATGVAMIGNEKLRSKVLDTLFGAEEEFSYTPPASTSGQPATPVSAS